MTRTSSSLICLLLIALVICIAAIGTTAAFGEKSSNKKQTTQKKQASSAIKPADLQFFENKIRPLLVKHCINCHGPKEQQGELRLDQHQFVIKKTDTGSAVVPGQPKKSRMIDVIQYNPNDSQMPPKGKLTPEEISLLTKWVKMGAPWTPEKKGAAATHQIDFNSFDFEKARQNHWAYRPLSKPKIPIVKQTAMAPTPIDRFVQSRLEEKGLALSSEADKRTLIRRATFDLIGLPPTYEETEAFVNDHSADAYTKLIDRLLASPHYGERWGRHWLDVARYADTRGYVFMEDTNYPFAYTYRDYVVRAFNEDLPYDQFLLEQIAADLIDKKGDNRKLAALGFLTVGDRFSNKSIEIINDRIDLVSRGLLGMTAACARCHDHKFDPIPTDDYYSLYGIFASSEEPLKLPLVSKPKPTPEYLTFQKELAKLEKAYKEKQKEYSDLLRIKSRIDITDYLIHVVLRNHKKLATPELTENQPHTYMLGRWIRFIRRKTNTSDPVFSIWHQFDQIGVDNFEQKAKALIDRNFDIAKRKKNAPPLNTLVIAAFKKSPPKTMLDVAEIYGDLLDDANRNWLVQQKKNNTIKKLTNPEQEQLRQVLYADATPCLFTPSEIPVRSFNRKRKQHLRELSKKITNYQRTSPHSPPRSMVLYDRDTPISPRVFIRGNPSRPGKTVPLRFFQLLSNSKIKTSPKGSGRLQLAQGIVDKKNPLTARVFVNRVWRHHFGTGLVETPSDFGVQGSPPSHPKLLDYLAISFIESDWSIKNLHRHIMHTAVYRQSGKDNQTAYQVDPENRLLWKKSVRRLEFEAMRDSILLVTGVLDRTIGGRPFNLEKRPFQTRRTLYGKIDRNDLPNLLQNFDFATPDASVAKRSNTTVPQQALYGMNNIFMIEMSKKLAKHPDLLQAKTTRKKLIVIYRKVFARNPTQQELQLGEEYIATQTKKHSLLLKSKTKPKSNPKTKKKGKPNPLNAWEQYAQILLLTNEFHFIK